MHNQMSADSSRGKVLNLISNNNHKVVKYMHIASDTTTIKCRKIVLLKLHKKKYIQHIKNQIEQIKDYLTRRFNYDNQIGLKDILDVTTKNVAQEQIQITLNTPYQQFITLNDFYNTDRLQMMRNQSKICSPTQPDLFMHFIRQIFQLVTRAGGLDNFFYTPKNIFFQKPPIKKQKEDFNLFKNGKLLLNHTSLTAIKLFFSKEQISKKDLQQIYPCLPYNYQKYVTNYQDYVTSQEGVVKDKSSLQRLNVVIKMRAFGWLLFTYMIKSIPNLLQFQGNQLTIDRPQMMQKIRQSPMIFQALLTLPMYRQSIDNFQKTTKIRLFHLLNQIFIYNCQNLKNWQVIYKYLFPNTRFLSQQYHQQILEELWKQEYFEMKKFYKTKGLYCETKHVYCLVKMNENYHEVLQQENIVLLLLMKQFCRINSNIYINIIHQKVKPHQQKTKNIQQQSTFIYSTEISTLQNTAQPQEIINRKQAIALYHPESILKNNQNQIPLRLFPYNWHQQIPQNLPTTAEEQSRTKSILQQFEILDFKGENILQIAELKSKPQILGKYPAERLFRGLIRTQMIQTQNGDRFTICSAPKQLTCIIDMQSLLW